MRFQCEKEALGAGYVLLATNLLTESLAGIYEASFPPEERRPVESLADLAADPASPLTLYAVVGPDGRECGLLTAWTLGGCNYMEHFAIDPALRGNGIGGRALDALMRRRSGPWLIEVEPADSSPEAARRIEFYCRHGFTPREEYAYIQPPYAPGLPAVELLLMTSAPIELDTEVSALRRLVYDCTE